MQGPIRAFTLTAFALSLFAAAAAEATPGLPSLKGEVILTVSGLDPGRFPGGSLRFDLGRLKALGVKDVHTSTIWTDGVQDFTGVPLVNVTHFLHVTTGTLHASALNDYAVNIPVSDAVKGGPIIAYARGGEVMSIREKGPLWIVYPFDRNPGYRNEVTYSRSIWQLNRIEVTH